ncbi:uncharacterized protein LOC111121214 isoform X2 [Crassostrea virginica]
MDISAVQSKYRQLDEDVEQQTDVKTIPNEPSWNTFRNYPRQGKRLKFATRFNPGTFMPSKRKKKFKASQFMFGTRSFNLSSGSEKSNSSSCTRQEKHWTCIGGETQHSQVDDDQHSTTSFNSSDYASCGNYKKESKRSNSSSLTYLEPIDGEGVAEEETQHSQEENHQQGVTSFNRSAYASCGNFKKESKRSNASSHTYVEVDDNRTREAVAGEEKTELKKRSKKYLYICGVVLVVAIISVGVAYLLSTNNMNDKLKSQVKEGVNELPNKEFMKQVVSNVTDVEHLAHVFSNISNMGMKEVQAKMEVLFKDLPEILSDVADRNLSIHSVMNELKVGLANQTKEVHQLAGKLSQMADKENMEQVISNITKEGVKYAVTDIGKELPDKEYIKQVVTNITKEEMKNTVNLLLKDKEHLELVVANITTEEVKNYMDVVKKDIYDLTKDIKKHLYKFINGTRCVASCSGLADGNYQSCHTCEGYISCVGGSLIPRSCQPHHPNQTVFWDDFEKRCNFVSYTCDTKYLQVLVP